MEATDVLAYVRSRLESDGWEVRMHEPSSETSAGIDLSHPLTSGSAFAWRSDDPNPIAFVASCLTDREFEVIRSRPTQMPHESLIGRIRVSAQANSWDADVVAVVARILRHEGLLTDAEAAWLEEAGPAWHDEVASA
jgi:hypothetical protein